MKVQLKNGKVKEFREKAAQALIRNGIAKAYTESTKTEKVAKVVKEPKAPKQKKQK